MGIVKGPFNTGAPISIPHFAFDVQAGAQLRHRLRVVALEAYAYGHALLDLDEIARGVILRYEREGRARSIRHRLHTP